ncbi:UDP-N-acetylmuramate dehydrogenase [Eggerthellaceae bacterium zg-893]|nr:UDP-N-acetylmuramate dehydrogenase [Eggerthellaceae bacterium zg-893]
MENAYDRSETIQAIQRELASLSDGTVLRTNVPLSALTTFEIGGPADVLVEPRSVEAVAAVCRACREAAAPLRVLGLGSDVLASDAGVRGVVMRLAENFARITVDGCTVTAQAGASNADVAEAAAAAGLAGYEFASGIPGTVGGAAIMNAGAYGGEFKDVATSVRCLAPNGDVVDVDAEEAAWSYRHSMMDGAGYVVLSATLELRPGDVGAIRAEMEDLARRRAEKQPLELPSAGSTFKRPEGHYVGKLVEEAGLRGYAVGGAQVSEKHTGFVVNAGGATARDVLALIEHVKCTVLESAGVELVPEVRLWGFEGE